jgi:exosortase
MIKSAKISLQTVILFSIFLFVSGLLLYPFFLEFYRYWDSEPEASSALMIPLFSVYMLWIQRGKLKNIDIGEYDISFSRTGFYLLILGLALFVFGRFIYILLLQACALVLITISTILFLYGKNAFRFSVVPVLFLLFILPIPESLYNIVAEPLKNIIAYFSASILSFLNVPLLKEANVIYLPSISLSIHESCSGIRTTISLLAISSAFSYIFLKAYRFRIIFIVISIPIGVFINVLRVVIIGILAYLINGDVAMIFHGKAWIFVTPVGIITIFIAGYMFRCRELKES